MCISCKMRRVRRFTATTVTNRGCDFVKCMNHNPHEGGCDFWYWIDEYAWFLGETGTIPKESPMLIPKGWVELESGICGDSTSRRAASEDLDEIVRPLLGIVKEISEMIKMIVCLLIVIIAVMLYKN
ncbi:hypothetical protein BRADI_1g47680v3 [Brachypodium distachyon]|uniref:GRF-type domain-containing protein n=1 Tax=Brachypodium distachyon TaxID=15368 RepID=I1H0G8_BRADI|nr:hypothetical protein BRADI_1g47680v3 [Brachypodium distachyon]